MCGRFLCLKGIQQVQCKKVKSFSDRQYSFFLKYRIFISTIKSNPLIVLNKSANINISCRYQLKHHEFRTVFNVTYKNCLLYLNNSFLSKSLLPYPKKDQFIWNDIGWCSYHSTLQCFQFYIHTKLFSHLFH